MVTPQRPMRTGRLDASRAAWRAVMDQLRQARMADAQGFAAEVRADLDELLGRAP